MERFSKIYRHLKSKIVHKFHYLLFIFYFISIFDVLFPISPNETCQKILDVFVVLYYMDYRFYERILKNS